MFEVCGSGRSVRAGGVLVREECSCGWIVQVYIVTISIVSHDE